MIGELPGQVVPHDLLGGAVSEGDGALIRLDVGWEAGAVIRADHGASEVGGAVGGFDPGVHGVGIGLRGMAGTV